MKYFSCGSFGMGQASEAIAEVGKALLHVKRNGIINLTADTLFGQMLFQRIAPTIGNTDPILIPNVRSALVVIWQLECFVKPSAFKESRVPFGMLLTRICISIQMSDLHIEDSRLDGI